jgi:hypothetical protein
MLFFFGESGNIRGEEKRAYCSTWWPAAGLAVGDSTTGMITIDALFTPLVLLKA